MHEQYVYRQHKFRADFNMQRDLMLDDTETAINGVYFGVI